MEKRAREVFGGPRVARPLRAAVPRVVASRQSRLSWITGTIKLTVFFLVLVLVLKGSVFEAFYVPSSSMRPTLKVSDYILVPKFIYGLRLPFVQSTVLSWASPSRGDVVVFIHSPNNLEELTHEFKGNLVKRVIGMEGDTVEVLGDQVFVNGTKLDEPYAQWNLGGRHLTFGPIQVPHGSVFVMGDNRDDSEDSRFWQDPFVKIEHIQGRVLLVYWSSSNLRRSGTFIR
jgi:signal peptidase I